MQILLFTQSVVNSRMVCFVILNYHSFKIFFHFWLTQIPRVIHFNQLGLTNFGRCFWYPVKWYQQYKISTAKEKASKKPWEQGYFEWIRKRNCCIHFSLHLKNYANHRGRYMLKLKSKWNPCSICIILQVIVSLLQQLLLIICLFFLVGHNINNWVALIKFIF